MKAGTLGSGKTSDPSLKATYNWMMIVPRFQRRIITHY
jgi:hypothetical protein